MAWKSQTCIPWVSYATLWIPIAYLPNLWILDAWIAWTFNACIPDECIHSWHMNTQVWMLDAWMLKIWIPHVWKPILLVHWKLELDQIGFIRLTSSSFQVLDAEACGLAGVVQKNTTGKQAAHICMEGQTWEEGHNVYRGFRSILQAFAINPRHANNDDDIKHFQHTQTLTAMKLYIMALSWNGLCVILWWHDLCIVAKTTLMSVFCAAL